MLLLDLPQIRGDGGTQPRAQIDLFVVDEYAQAMRDGAVFPPVIVFYDGQEYWLADGFHRLTAARNVGLAAIEASVKQGRRREALLFSVGANTQHGLRRTNADKRRAIETLLADEEWAKWSDRELARRAGVSNDFVSRLRPTAAAAICHQMTDSSSSSDGAKDNSGGNTTSRLAFRNGTTYTLNTNGIGKATIPPPLPSAPTQLQQAELIKPEPEPQGEEQRVSQVSNSPDLLLLLPSPPPLHPSSRISPQARELVAQTAARDNPEELRLLSKFGPEKQLAVANRLAQATVVNPAFTVAQAKKEVLIEEARSSTQARLHNQNEEDEEAPAQIQQMGGPDGYRPTNEAVVKPRLRPWRITHEQAVITEDCAAVITDPPYGILQNDEVEWEPVDLKTFTLEWVSRWASACRADSFLIFWSQRYLWEGRQWFDQALSPNGYCFHQLLIWHYPNGVKPGGSGGFKVTYDPIFFYKRAETKRKFEISPDDWGLNLTRFDCQVGAIPQSNYNGAEMKLHPAQKPVAVLRSLIATTTLPGELVADPFCGSGTTGIAASQLGRRFHGIVNRDEDLALARERISSYGQKLCTPEILANSSGRSAI